MTAKEQHRAEVFSRDPHECAMGTNGRGFSCRGRLQADHVIELAWLMELHKRRRHVDGFGLAENFNTVIADGRNGMVLCERHHGLKTSGLLVIPRSVIPQSVFDFADAYDCAHLLEGRACFA